MATMPPRSETPPISAPAPSKTKAEEKPRTVRTAPKDVVRAAIKRIASDHRELIKDLAK